MAFICCIQAVDIQADQVKPQAVSTPWWDAGTPSVHALFGKGLGGIAQSTLGLLSAAQSQLDARLLVHVVWRCLTTGLEFCVVLNP